jgi:UDP-N-acetyl-2-amino-2-deoxyglucuronate dehydrogenase
MKAMVETGGELVAAVDPNDSVGIIDSYFPDARFFGEIETFEAYIRSMRREGRPVDYLTVASPSYLHAAHIQLGMNAGMNVICEKPVVLFPNELDDLAEVQDRTRCRVDSILQLRLHPAIRELRDRLASEPDDRMHEIVLTYIASRGDWYLQSWKSRSHKSGGIVAEIGIHFIDALHFLFGDLRESRVDHMSLKRAAGYLEFSKARVYWFLSIELEDVPERLRNTGQRTYRSMTIDGEEIDFSGGFTDLHTLSYEEILAGRGFGLNANRPAIECMDAIRNATSVSGQGPHHPFLDRIAE